VVSEELYYNVTNVSIIVKGTLLREGIKFTTLFIIYSKMCKAEHERTGVTYSY